MWYLSSLYWNTKTWFTAYCRNNRTIRKYVSFAYRIDKIFFFFKDGKETYRSDKIKIDVPYERTRENRQIINIRPLSESTDTLQGEIQTDFFSFFTCCFSDLINEHQSKSKTSLIKPPPILTQTKRTSTFSCRCRYPHTTFPGLDHYFNNDNDDDDDVVYD